MTELVFTWDSKDLKIWEDRRVEKAVASALSKSGSKAIRSLKVESNREVRSKKRIKVKRINDSMPLQFPADKGDVDLLVWRMRVSGKALRVSDFSYRQTKKGVTFGLNTGGKRTLIKGAFVATMKSGHTGVFRRRGKARLPIDEAFGPRVSDVMKDVGVIPRVLFGAQTVFSREFERLLPIELAKVKR